MAGGAGPSNAEQSLISSRYEQHHSQHSSSSLSPASSTDYGGIDGMYAQSFFANSRTIQVHGIESNSNIYLHILHRISPCFRWFLRMHRVRIICPQLLTSRRFHHPSYRRHSQVMMRFGLIGRLNYRHLICFAICMSYLCGYIIFNLTEYTTAFQYSSNFTRMHCFRLNMCLKLINYCRHANRLFHAKTFMASISVPPSHPKFPPTFLLHAICAISTLYTAEVSSPPLVSMCILHI